LKLHPVRIRITNFQSIDDLEIEVHGFTCITGPSNIGKSAIIRATSSAILNNPVVGMVRKGESFCTVTITSEGWGFRWEKNDKGVNRVFIPPNKQTPLDKIGQVQVPDIAKMGFSSIEVGDDEIQPWLAPQFQAKGCGPLFLLDQSGPRVTDFLSEVSRLTVLQDAIVAAARGKRSATDQAKIKNEEAAALKTKLARIGTLDSLEKLGKELAEQNASIDEYEHKIQIGEALVLRREEAERVIGTLEKIDGLRIPRDHCGELVQKVRDLYTFCYQLEACATRIREIRDVGKVKVPDSKALKADVERVQSLAGFGVKISSLQASVNLLDQPIKVPSLIKEVKELTQLNALNQTSQTLYGEITDLEAQLAKINKELATVDDEISAIPTCPTCSRPMSSAHTGKHRRTVA